MEMVGADRNKAFVVDNTLSKTEVLNIKQFLLLLILLLFIFIGRIYFRDLLWLLVIIEFIIGSYIVYSIIKNISSYKKDSNYRILEMTERIRVVLEPRIGRTFLLEVVLTELTVFYYAIFVFFNKPNVNVGRTFTYHKSSQIKTFIIVFSILIIGEGLLFHYLFQRWSEVFAWIFTVLNVYGLLYLVGFYHSVKYLPHVMEQKTLLIRLGFQSSIKVDIDNIKYINKAKECGFDMKIPKDTYYSLLKIDSPQYELMLKKPIEMCGAYGRKRMVNTIVFRADEPNEFLEELNFNREFEI